MSPPALRVAIVCPYALETPGGVQSHVVRLAHALSVAGDEVLIVAPGSARTRPRSTEGVAWAGVGSIVRVPFNGAVAPIGWTPQAARRTARVLRAWRPDVVHVHEPSVPVVGWSAALSRAAPVVATLHAYAEHDRVYRRVGPLLARSVLGRVTLAIAVSPAARDFHAAALGWDPDQIRVVPNGVDVATFAPDADGSRSPEATDARSRDGRRARQRTHGERAAATILFVGRLDRRKGLGVLIESFEMLRRQRDVRLIVVGDGPDRQLPAQRLKPSDLAAVELRGRVPNDELAGAYQQAQVYVAPSLGGESFGIVLLEAMAAGTPVVASDIPGYRAVLEGGRYGRLVTPRDPAGLAEAIGATLDEPDVTRALVDRARRHAETFDWPLVAARVRDRYLEALGPR